MTTSQRERPIPFSGPMVRAILDGRKTQTRRVIKPQPEMRNGFVYGVDAACSESFFRAEPWNCIKRLPFVVGMTLWVRETWYLGCPDDDGPFVGYLADDSRNYTPIELGALSLHLNPHSGNRPSIHMPRWASRITLELTGVRVERVQDITEEDAKAEGFVVGPMVLCSHCTPTAHVKIGATGEFRSCWDSINAKRGFGWAVNPWVWCLTFRRIKP
jgi:hypothetical protein